MKESLNSVNLPAMCSSENISKRSKIDIYLHILQKIKAIFFLKLKEGSNENLFSQEMLQTTKKELSNKQNSIQPYRF